MTQRLVGFASPVIFVFVEHVPYYSLQPVSHFFYVSYLPRFHDSPSPPNLQVYNRRQKPPPTIALTPDLPPLPNPSHRGNAFSVPSPRPPHHDHLHLCSATLVYPNPLTVLVSLHFLLTLILFLFLLIHLLRRYPVGKIQ